MELKGETGPESAQNIKFVGFKKFDVLVVNKTVQPHYHAEGTMVSAQDYDALQAENARLQAEVEALKNHRFAQGYLCAVATLIMGHGHESQADDLFKECAMTINEMQDAGIDEGDIEVLRRLAEEHEARIKHYQNQIKP